MLVRIGNATDVADGQMRVVDVAGTKVNCRIRAAACMRSTTHARTWGVHSRTAIWTGRR